MSEEPDRVAMRSDLTVLKSDLEMRIGGVETRMGGLETAMGSLEDRLIAKINASAEETRRYFDVIAEKLRDDVKRVYDVLIGQHDRNKANDADHTAFRTQLDDHDVRILALEKNDRRV